MPEGLFEAVSRTRKLPTDEPKDSTVTQIGRDTADTQPNTEICTGDPDFEGVTRPECSADDLEVISFWGAPRRR